MRTPTGFEQDGNDNYHRLELTCPREGCGATNVSISGDQAKCNFCGHESDIERFIPETLDVESYKGY